MRKFILAAALAAASATSALADTVTVGMSGGYFPFTFVKQDKLQGFEVDFINALAE
jgi:putative amino-acid transport system substrate-binding protein